MNLTATSVDDTLAYIEGSLADLQASMHTDLMAGRPLELEALNGGVVHAGQAVEVSTLINALIYAALKPYVEVGWTFPQQIQDVRET